MFNFKLPLKFNWQAIFFEKISFVFILKGKRELLVQNLVGY
jgi:hypothetical protein